MIIVRYADDFIVGFQHESDARRFLDEMRERLQKFALTLHPEKTRLIEFGRFAAERRQRRGLGKPETFNFLGFTFICGKTRAGKFQIKRKTRARPHANEAQDDQRGDVAAHAPADPRSGEMAVVRRQRLLQLPRSADQRSCTARVPAPYTDLWRRTLRRRSQKDRMTWERMTQLVDDWLPKPIILHPWPSDRFAVTHPRWESYGAGGGGCGTFIVHEPMEVAPVVQINDLSRSLAAFDPISTLEGGRRDEQGELAGERRCSRRRAPAVEEAGAGSRRRCCD